MEKIFLEQNMNYFIYDTIEEVNAKAAEIIMKNEYDFVAVYNEDCGSHGLNMPEDLNIVHLYQAYQAEC